MWFLVDGIFLRRDAPGARHFSDRLRSPGSPPASRTKLLRSKR